jgi:hypothetical protein
MKSPSCLYNWTLGTFLCILRSLINNSNSEVLYKEYIPQVGSHGRGYLLQDQMQHLLTLQVLKCGLGQRNESLDYRSRPIRRS